MWRQRRGRPLLAAPDRTDRPWTSGRSTTATTRGCADTPRRCCAIGSASDDVVQETFLRAQSHLESVREPDKVAAWLFRVAHNLCMDQLRARQASRIDPAADPETAATCGSVSRPA